MKKWLLCGVTFSLAACGCRSVNHENVGVPVVKVDKGVIWQSDQMVDLAKDSHIPVVDLIDSIRLVQLEANDKCLINTIGKILFYQNRYFILDERQQVVLCFDQNGRFVRKISDRGRGGQEYEYLEDIAIDPYNEQLLLVVPFGSILCFDLDGNFISKTYIPDARAINEAYVLDSDRWLFVSLYAEQILYFSKKWDQIVERLYERGPTMYPVFPLSRSYAYNDSIYFSPILSDVTINMKDENRHIAFVWDFGDKNNKQQKVESLVKELHQVKNNSFLVGVGRARESLRLVRQYLNYHILFTRESSRYRMAVLDYKGEEMHVLFDKREHRTIVFRETKEGIRWINPQFMHNQDIIITYDVEGAPYKGYAEEVLSPEQRQIVEAHNPEVDNPFLVIYHLKK